MSRELDMRDPFDAHAFFICGFECGDCRAEIPRDDPFLGCDDASCCHISDRAKALGWYVPPPKGPERRMDVETTYCPACARRRGLRPSSAEAP